jgi:hypothetical protein
VSKANRICLRFPKTACGSFKPLAGPKDSVATAGLRKARPDHRGDEAVDPRVHVPDSLLICGISDGALSVVFSHRVRERGVCSGRELFEIPWLYPSEISLLAT